MKAGNEETDKTGAEPVHDRYFDSMRKWKSSAGGQGKQNCTLEEKTATDRLIANGNMEPMIVVTPIYYQDNEEKGRTVEEEDAFLVANAKWCWKTGNHA